MLAKIIDELDIILENQNFGGKGEGKHLKLEMLFLI